jgi:hypothetical protein
MCGRGAKESFRKVTASQLGEEGINRGDGGREHVGERDISLRKNTPFSKFRDNICSWSTGIYIHKIIIIH